MKSTQESYHSAHTQIITSHPNMNMEELPSSIVEVVLQHVNAQKSGRPPEDPETRALRNQRRSAVDAHERKELTFKWFEAQERQRAIRLDARLDDTSENNKSKNIVQVGWHPRRKSMTAGVRGPNGKYNSNRCSIAGVFAAFFRIIVFRRRKENRASQQAKGEWTRKVKFASNHI